MLTDDIEKQLRKARKVLRNIDDMMAKPVRSLNGDQKNKILRRDEVAREVHQLEASLAALLPPPADEDGDEDEDGAAGEAAADVRGQEGGERAAMSYYRERLRRRLQLQQRQLLPRERLQRLLLQQRPRVAIPHCTTRSRCRQGRRQGCHLFAGARWRLVRHQRMRRSSLCGRSKPRGVAS